MNVYLPLHPSFPLIERVLDIVLVLLVIFGSIQIFYYLFIFSRLLTHTQNLPASPDTSQGVSVLVCAWDELINLRELLPLLDAQAYSKFEVLVLDDRSDDGTEEFLKAHVHEWSHIRSIRIEKEYAHITPKKYALTVGLKHACHEVVLLTDADCRPVDSTWIGSMVARLDDTKEIVLGFSPYHKEAGLLNWFIRCETFYTAVQYLSFAIAGYPYMGVGRNLMYRTALFFRHKGFYKHNHVTGGDDDLFMNQAATARNVAINLDPASFVYSEPKKTWNQWYRQKKRHLSVGKYYRQSNKVRLGLLSGSHSGMWVLGIIVLIWGLIEADTLALQVLAGVFSIRWLVQTLVLSGINKRLGRTVEWFTFIPMDLAFFVYYVGMSGLVFSHKKINVTWR